MPVDLSLSLRKEVLMHLENDASVTSFVPASRIYGMSVPALPDWPFIRYGTPINTGYEATCWNGMESTVTLHVFTETTLAASGEDEAMLIAEAIVKSMNSFKPTSIGLIDNVWTSGNIFREESEADRYHAVIQFSITAVTLH